MVTSSAGPDGQERRDPTTTLTGWRQFVGTDPASFTLLAGEQLAALTRRAGPPMTRPGFPPPRGVPRHRPGPDR